MPVVTRSARIKSLRLIGAALITLAATPWLGMVPASADHKDDHVQGNEECPEGSVLVAKFEVKGNAFQLVEGGNVTITAGATKEDGGSWTSTTQITWVVVKGSTLATASAVPPPGLAGTFDDDGLEQHDISHVTFCGPTGGSTTSAPVTTTPSGSTTTATVTSTVTNTVTTTAPGTTNTVTTTAPGTTNTVTTTAPGETHTVTTTAPGETITTTLPGNTQTVTTTAPGSTETVTSPGPTVTVTVTETAPTQTVTNTVTTTQPGSTTTVTQPGQTQTVTTTAPGETVTTTAPGSTQTVTVTQTGPGATVTTTAPGQTETVTTTAPGETETVTTTAPGSTNTATVTVTVTETPGTSVLPTKIGNNGGGGGDDDDDTGVLGTKTGVLADTGIELPFGTALGLSFALVLVGGALMIVPSRLAVERSRRH